MPRGYRDEDRAPRRSLPSDEGSEPVRFDNTRAIKATKMALLCSIDGDDVWIPISQITDDSEVFREGDEGTLVITWWLAYQKGLVGL